MASKSPEAGRGMEQILPQCSQKAPTLLTPWSWTSSLQDCETMNFLFTRLAVLHYMEVLARNSSIKSHDLESMVSCILYMPSVQ